MQTLEDILTADLRDSYGLNCGRLQPVAGGWMNKKWQTIAGGERLLIKQFSRERFQPSQLDQIGAALQRQMILEEKGIPCPHILPYRQRPLRILEDGTVYMVMRFCPGRMENRDTITAEQLRSLGSVCGRMHQEFAMLPEQGVRGFPIDGRRVLSALWDHFHTRRDNIPEDAPPAYREALLAQEPSCGPSRRIFSAGSQRASLMRIYPRTICSSTPIKSQRSWILTATNTASSGMISAAVSCPSPCGRGGWISAGFALSWKAMRTTCP